jgi:hypothetical protein
MLWFTYSNGEQLMGIGIGVALGHNWVIAWYGPESQYEEGLRCTDCGTQIPWYEMSEEMLEMYHGMGGQGGLS